MLEMSMVTTINTLSLSYIILYYLFAFLKYHFKKNKPLL